MTTMTTTSATPRRHERWANLRHAIIGALLAAPPDRGELRAALDALAARTYLHPITGAPVQFAFSTIERWWHLARKAAGHGDTVQALRRKIRKDAGTRRSVSSAVVAAIGCSTRRIQRGATCSTPTTWWRTPSWATWRATRRRTRRSAG